MIEMLGVLAIIGVLSIGANAGYQKAMMKYKLNKYVSILFTLQNKTLLAYGNDNILKNSLNIKRF